jgi:Helix-turn-helix domain
MMSDPNSKRKVTYRLYPTPRQSELLLALLRHHQQLYNAALEERISAWQKVGKSISYADQCSSLTQLRNELPEWAAANCSSQQMTLRRLDKAYQAFFRRVKKGREARLPKIQIAQPLSRIFVQVARRWMEIYARRQVEERHAEDVRRGACRLPRQSAPGWLDLRIGHSLS